MPSKTIGRLKSKVQIDLVFKKGKVIKSGVLILHFVEPIDGESGPLLGVGVSKRFVLLAHRRNRIKRQIRGVIQKQRNEVLKVFPTGFYMILYKGKISAETESLHKDIKGLLEWFKVHRTVGNTVL